MIRGYPWKEVIVRPDGNDLLLVTQPAHAELSGRIMAAWRRDDLPASPTRATVLLATREHDNGWLEVDNRPEHDADRPPATLHDGARRDETRVSGHAVFAGSRR